MDTSAKFNAKNSGKSVHGLKTVEISTIFEGLSLVVKIVPKCLQKLQNNGIPLKCFSAKISGGKNLQKLSNSINIINSNK